MQWYSDALSLSVYYHHGSAFIVLCDQLGANFFCRLSIQKSPLSEKIFYDTNTHMMEKYNFELTIVISSFAISLPKPNAKNVSAKWIKINCLNKDWRKMPKRQLNFRQSQNFKPHNLHRGKMIFTRLCKRFPFCKQFWKQNSIPVEFGCKKTN